MMTTVVRVLITIFGPMLEALAARFLWQWYLHRLGPPPQLSELYGGFAILSIALAGLQFIGLVTLARIESVQSSHQVLAERLVYRLLPYDMARRLTAPENPATQLLARAVVLYGGIWFAVGVWWVVGVTGGWIR